MIIKYLWLIPLVISIELPMTRPLFCDDPEELLVSTYRIGQKVDIYDSTHGPFLHFLQNAIIHCCHPNATLHLHHIYESARHMEETYTNETFLVPLTRSESHLAAASYYHLHPAISFLPLVESPGAFMFVGVDADDTALVLIIASAWPILVIIFVTSGLSAILIWALERYSNATAFPKTFQHGSWEGFWWAVVTMTTVGYGDRTPVTPCGRLFSMVWIITGVVIMAIFTATLTTSFTEESANLKNIPGIKLGVLNGSMEESLAFLLGADIQAYNHLSQLTSDLKEEHLDGALLSNLVTMSHATAFIDNNIKMSSFVSAPAVHGVLIQGIEDVEFHRCLTMYAEKKRFALLDDIRSNADPLERRRGKEGPEKMSNLLSSSLLVVYVMCGLLATCVVCLGTWEAVHVYIQRRTELVGVQGAKSYSSLHDYTAIIEISTCPAHNVCRPRYNLGPQSTKNNTASIGHVNNSESTETTDLSVHHSSHHHSITGHN